jgi:hypothetical protein
MGRPGVGAYLAAGLAAGALFAGARAIASQVSAASEFRREMEMGQLGLATMYNLVDKMPLAPSLERAQRQMLKFNVMAAEAPGAGQDMMKIYSRMYAPMKRLGVASAQIEERVKGAAVMGKVMDIKDIGALGRDVEEMLTGRAGKRRTKIFALANAWGLINMEAKEFNALAPEERLRITMGLIDNFTAHGERMAKTWDGASEAFGGWMSIIRDFAGRGFFTTLGQELYELNQAIERSLPQIRGYMELAGRSMGRTIGGAATVARGAAGATHLNPLVAGEAGLAGGILGAAGAMTLLVSLLGRFLLPASALAKVMAVIASIGILPILLGVGAVIATVVAGFQVMTQYADTFGRFMTSLVMGPLGIVIHILSSLFWGIIAVFRAAIGAVTYFSGGLQLLHKIFVTIGFAVLVVVEAFRVLMETFGRLMASFDGLGAKAVEMDLFVKSVQIAAAQMLVGMGEFFSKVMGWIASLVRAVPFVDYESQAVGLELAGTTLAAESMMAAKRVAGMNFDDILGGDGASEDGKRKGLGGKKFQAPSQINVQRLIINQDFKGKADPDRVVASFMTAITDQANAAMSSPVDVSRGT